MAETARDAGFDRVIGFDMGGTSTDVSHYSGYFERTSDAVVAGVRLRAPMLSIHTVAAGGGSICRFDGSRLRVGPESAGAVPGPAAYRRGGPLTVTDCNILLGKLRPEFFPAVFGPDGNQPLDHTAVAARFDALAAEVAAATGRPSDPLDLAEGFVAIAVQNMAEAIKSISIQRGHDLTGYVLNCFGGAGGQHACLVADALGMTTVMLHPFAGVSVRLRNGTRLHPDDPPDDRRRAPRCRRPTPSSPTGSPPSTPRPAPSFWPRTCPLPRSRPRPAPRSSSPAATPP